MALNVDQLDQSSDVDAADASQLLARINFPFRTGKATATTMDKIEVIQRFLFDRRLPFSVPLGLLVDQQGQLATLYRGRMRIDVLLEHVKALEATPRSWRELSVPMVGRWYTEPARLNPRTLAKWFEEPYPDEAERFLLTSIALTASTRRTIGASPKLDFEVVEARRRLAVICDRQDRHREAALHCKEALAIDPHDEHLRYLLDRTLIQSGRSEEMLRLYQDALREDPSNVRLRYRLAIRLREVGRYDDAVARLSEVIERNPDFVDAHQLLGLIHGQLRQAERGGQFVSQRSRATARS